MVALKRPDDYDPGDGMRCELLFEKARNLDDNEVTTLAIEFSTKSGKAVFTSSEIKADVISQVHDMIKEGASRGEISKATGLDRFQLRRLQDRAKEQGRPFALPDSRTKTSAKVIPIRGGDDEF